jgi:uncharacterized protein (DUF2062 family)
MPKKFIKRFLPHRDKVKSHKHLQMFGTLLHSPNLWHLNRRSVAGAFAVGLFIAFVPVPFQMILAAGAAILFSVNLPLSVALVWITNPITIPPMFYGTYLVGNWLMGRPASELHIELSVDWLMHGLTNVWQPLLLGSFVCGTIASILGYVCIRLYWRHHVIKQWNKRKQRQHNISDKKH